MHPIETLMAEHRQIERVLAALEGMACDARAGSPGSRADLRHLVAFLRGYADTLHHLKEENLLFVAMVEAGFPRESGPIYVMLADHERGRALVSELAGLSAGDAPFSPAERGQLARAALAYCELLRGHIAREDRVLYPMAEAHLADATWELLEKQFAAVEQQQGAEADRLCAQVEPLIQAYAEGRRFQPEAAASKASCGGCGHES